MSKDQYLKDYIENSFWQKAQSALKAAGEQVLRLALKLYFSAQDTDTPVWAKTAIYSSKFPRKCTVLSLGHQPGGSLCSLFSRS